MLQPEQSSLPAPDTSNQPFHFVSALEAGYIDLPLRVFVKDADPAEVPTCPSLSFILRHSISGDLILFDMGLHINPSVYPPTVQGNIKKYFKLNTPQDVYASLRKGGVEPNQVGSIILSHVHFDHIGDTTEFIRDTDAMFIVGDGSDKLVREGYPSDEKSEFMQSTLPTDSSRIRVLGKTDFDTSIGPFPRACNLLGDGSLFVIEAGGHLAGHVNLLIRTSNDGGWLFLAADSAHDVGMIHQNRDIAVFPGPNGKVLCAHHDPEEAKAHLDRIRALSRAPRVQVLLAHDWEWDKTHKADSFLPNVIVSL